MNERERKMISDFITKNKVTKIKHKNISGGREFRRKYGKGVVYEAYTFDSFGRV